MKTTKKELAGLLGLSERRIEQLTEARVLVAPGGKYDLRAAVRAYVAYVRRGEDAPTLLAARIGKLRAEKALLDLKLEAERRDLIPIGPLAETLNRALGAIKARIQGSIQLEQKVRDEICSICERAYRAAFAGEPGPGVDDGPKNEGRGLAKVQGPGTSTGLAESRGEAEPQ